MRVMITEAEMIIETTTIEYHDGKVYFFYLDNEGKIASFTMDDPDKEIFAKVWEDTLRLDATVNIPRVDGSNTITTRNNNAGGVS